VAQADTRNRYFVKKEDFLPTNILFISLTFLELQRLLATV
jgi:hypothetical protein